MAIRQNKIQNRGRIVQRIYDPITQPLPIERDRFKTIVSADGKRTQTTQSIQELYYAEQYNRLTKDVWGVNFIFPISGLVTLYGWNIQAQPLKVEVQNNQDVRIWVNLTGTFAGPGTAPSYGQWNQAIMVLPGTGLVVPDLANINKDTTGQRFLEIFTNAVPTVEDPGSNVILYFNEPVSAPVQYSPP